MVFVVEIEDRTSPKPFLGGWRNVPLDLEYHDATSQTSAAYFCRPRFTSVRVQTSGCVERCNRSIGVGGIERAVQASGLLFPELSDYVVEPGLLKRRQAAAVKIQRFYRVYRNRRLDTGEDDGKPTSGTFDKASEDDNNNDIIDDLFSSDSESQDYRWRSESPVGAGKEFGGSQPPAADLAVLQSLLDRWSVAEAKETLGQEARSRESFKAEKSRIVGRDRVQQRQILRMELLRAIEGSRSEAARRRRSERARGKFLRELAQPVRLEVSNSTKQQSNKVSIETLNVQRAREFRDLYEALLTPEDADDEYLDVDRRERVELLLNVKRLASLHTCVASSNLEDLIDQELYFLRSSKVEPGLLRHLRSRVRLAFLSLARGALVPHDRRAMYSAKTRLCPSCSRLKGLEAFETDHRERLSRSCVDCAALRSRSREPELRLEIYERMLGELRRHEAARRDGASSLAFAMGPKAIGYLVNNIWHGRSAISECDDLSRLRLARLDPHRPWAPWNNLLVTRREARMHEALARESLGPTTVYNDELLRRLRRMNLQARLYFESLAGHSDTGISL